MWQIKKGFVSTIDQFLQTYDHEHPGLSPSQQKEVVKYKRIYALRDDPNVSAAEKTHLDDWFK